MVIVCSFPEEQRHLKILFLLRLMILSALCDDASSFILHKVQFLYEVGLMWIRSLEGAFGFKAF